MVLDRAHVPAESAASPADRFIARQPILNASLETAGYELLFRSGWENRFRGESDDATRQTLDNYLSMDIEYLTQGKPAFINCTREALVGGLVTLLPPRTTVLEILETVEPDAEVLETCMDLHRMGYRLALDDFVWRPEMQSLIEIASYVKVDFRLTDAAMRREIRAMTCGSQAAMLAEKVENQEEFEVARAEGFEYFQGYFFCRPTILANRGIPPNRMNYLQLLVELARKPLNAGEVIRIVEVEASLCYRLLRLANSPQWAIRNDITSVRGAYMRVGEDRFRNLVSVAASCALGQGQAPALIALSLERARFCELLAPLTGESAAEQFMLGLLSLLDAILQTPMESILRLLPLRSEAKAALLGDANRVAMPLCLVRSFESGAWGDCAGSIEAAGISEEALSALYLASVKWASDSLSSSH